MASTESKMTEKELISVRAFIKESVRSDIMADITLITKVTVLERLKKNKENEHDRYLAILGRPGRVVTVKSKLMGKSIESNIVILTVNELRYFVHRSGALFCCELVFNENTESLILCTPSLDAMHRILTRLLSAIRLVAECVLFEPKLIDVPDEVSNAVANATPNAITADHRVSPHSAPLSAPQPIVLSMAYQMLCIVEGIAIDGHLLSLFNDEEYHSTNRVFEIDYLLRHYAQSAPQAAKHGVSPLEVEVLLHSLHFVRSFSGLHLDGIPLTESIAKRLAKLVSRNEHIQSVALRNCSLSAVSWQSFSAVAHHEISRSDRKQRVLEHLTMSHNELRRHSVTMIKRKKKRRGKGGDDVDAPESVLQSMDSGMLCAKKLFFARCHLDRGLIEQIVDSVIDYRFLEKLDLSLNDLGGDGLITLKLSTMCRRVQCLEALLLRDCGLTLNFLTELLVNDNGYDYRHRLSYLDVGGNVMTHYAASAIGSILQNTVCPEVTVDVSCIKTMDQKMMESILLGPFHAPFKGISIRILLRDVGLCDGERLKAMDTVLSIAEQQKADCNGIQTLDLSANGLGSCFPRFCKKYISNLFCLETLCLDFNFVAAKKKGSHRVHIEALCEALSKLPLLRDLSIRGDFASSFFSSGGSIAAHSHSRGHSRSPSSSATPSRYLSADDLQPLLRFLANSVSDEYGDSPCCLEALCLDGNRLKDDGCKVIAQSLATNGRLQKLSMENNKCSFKGFMRIIDCIVAAEEANPSSIKLCDVPMASILDDPSFRSKIKKHKDAIRRCIAIIHRNRSQQRQTSSPMMVVEAQDVVEDEEEKSNDDDHKEEDRAQSPTAKYNVAHSALSNVDKLAVIMSASKMPKLRKAMPIEETPSSRASIKKSSATKTAKVVKTGMDALVDKGSADAKAQNAKSRRKKKTRKKIEI